jgi:hypothetical protein
MSISALDRPAPLALSVSFSDDQLSVTLNDGRTISAPLAWYPRLLKATAGELQDWRLLGDGAGIRWNQLDEDISVESLIAGRPSAETAESLTRWLASRA